MTRRNAWMIALAVPALAFAATVTAQGTKSLPGNETDPVTDKEMDYLVGLCEGCHGPGGRSDRPDVPALAGRPADELFAEIERFYFYERICPDVPIDGHDASKGHMSMCDITSQINKQEAEALAAHFEAQPAKAAP
jgi:cytochrome c553